jgi:hypothetical protein
MKIVARGECSGGCPFFESQHHTLVRSTLQNQRNFENVVKKSIKQWDEKNGLREGG